MSEPSKPQSDKNSKPATPAPAPESTTLNANAKPFTPSFGALASSGNNAAPNATTSPSKNNNKNNNNGKHNKSNPPFLPTPPLPPPMPFNPMLGMMGMYGMSPAALGLPPSPLYGGIGGLLVGPPPPIASLPPPPLPPSPGAGSGAAKLTVGGVPVSVGVALPTTATATATAPAHQQQPFPRVGGGNSPAMRTVGNGGLFGFGFNAPPPPPPHIYPLNKNNNNNGYPSATTATTATLSPSLISGGTPIGGPAKPPKPPLVFPRKVAFLVLGGRGSGKSTQCERLAKQFNLLHLAGGTYAQEKKQPHVELAAALAEHFVEGAPLGKAQLKKSKAPHSTLLLPPAATEENDSNKVSPDTENENKSQQGNTNDTTTTSPETNESSSPNKEEGAVAPSPPTTTTTTTAAATTAATATIALQDESEYNGVILDRFIAVHEYDAYYLDAVLRRFGLAVELVFLLMLDAETASVRAASRNDSKPVDHTRQMAEHRIQYVAVNSVYSPLNILHCVDCDNMPVEAITRALVRVVETHYASPATAAAAPPTPTVPHHPYTQGRCKLVTDFAKFHHLRNCLLQAVYDQPKPPLACPLTVRSGIADARMFVSPKQARPLVNAMATLKADGQRVLLFKHSAEGVFGINGIFHFIYKFDSYFEHFGIGLPAPPEGYAPAADHGIEWVLDAECFSVDGKTQIAVFDYLYLYGKRGSAQMLETRLGELAKFFSRVAFAPGNTANTVGTVAINGPSPFFMKQYVPATRLRELLPDPKNPPFPINGIVFQHMANYKFGRDNAVFVWKPKDKCTVDFRLDKARDPNVPGGEWCFVPMVGDVKEEVPWPNASVRVSDADARRADLCDGTIAECTKREPRNGHNNANSNFTVWDFVRIRPEKPTPNKIDIAKTVSTMEHLSFDELANHLEGLAKGGSK